MSGHTKPPPPAGTQDGDEYVSQLAQYIRINSDRLSATVRGNNGQRPSSSSSWMSSAFLGGSGGSSSSLKPLTLTISCYHLYYLLLRIQEAGFADVGDIDVKLEVDQQRRPAAASGNEYLNDISDARSVKTGWTFLSTSATSLSSGWWGSTSSSSRNAATTPDKNLRFIYTAFTLLPSLKLIMRDTKAKGKQKEVDGFPFAEYPGDRMVPLQAFKSLQRLEVQGIDARCLLFSKEWQGLKVIQIRDAGLESMADMLVQPYRADPLEWPMSLRVLDVENNDITGVDAGDLLGLEMLQSLSLRKNLLISVPSVLANLTSLRSLDLSENMIDSVLAIYKSLGALQVLNLRANRISSLCGLERLLSLEVLDLRDNEIQDAAELGRLAVLPHLRELYVQDGNPFVDDPSGITENGWRIDLFNAFLKEAGPSQGLSKEDLLSLDGYPPTWNEKRYLVEPSRSTFREQRRPARHVNHKSSNAIARGQHEQQHTDIGPHKSRQAASTGSAARARPHRAADASPPPPVPALDDIYVRKEGGVSVSTRGPPSGPANGTPSAATPASPSAKLVKRKHKRIVDLDGNAGPIKHERSVSTPHRSEGRGMSSNAAVKGEDAIGNGDGVKSGHFHTISSHPSNPSNSRNGSRRLSQGMFDAPPTVSRSARDGQVATGREGKAEPGNSGSGSDVEEFRRKMEKLRDEVGVENWLSVYSSASAANTPSTEVPVRRTRAK